MHRLAAYLLLAILVAATVSGCGSDDEPSGDGPATKKPVKPEPKSEFETMPLRIATIDTVSLGTPATDVVALAGLVLRTKPTMDAAINSFGKPDSDGPSDADPNVCAATWKELGIETLFYFGHPPSPERSCEEGVVAGATMTGDRWITHPGGLAIGDEVAKIKVAHPKARPAKLPALPARDLDTTEGFVLEHGAYGGDPYPTLYAAVDDGAVVALLYVSGAD